MRHTSILRILAIDKSQLASNMYHLLLRDLPGHRIEITDRTDGIADRQRRAKPHVIVINSNMLKADELPDFVTQFPTILLSSPDRMDLKEAARTHDNIAFVEKPFYPFDLIAVVHRLASQFHPVKETLDA